MSRFQVTPAVFLLLIKKDKVLLLLRKGTGYMDGYYSLVAGHMDGNETVKDAMIREAKEEANIDLHPDHIDVSLVMHRFSTDERIDFFVTANYFEGEITNMEPDKCEQLCWFPVNELPKNIVPNVRFAIESVEKGHHFVQFDDRNL